MRQARLPARESSRSPTALRIAFATAGLSGVVSDNERSARARDLQNPRRPRGSAFVASRSKRWAPSLPCYASYPLGVTSRMSVRVRRRAHDDFVEEISSAASAPAHLIVARVPESSQITHVRLSAPTEVTARWSRGRERKPGPVSARAKQSSRQEHFSKRLGTRATARLTSGEDADPLPLQPRCQAFRVAGFSSSFTALECDEAPPRFQGSHPNSSSPSASTARA